MNDTKDAKYMLFSLIVPMYNAEKYISRCIKSIKDQTCEDFEVLLVDDGSTDNTVLCCMRNVDGDERFKIIKVDDNRGVSAARNLGLKNAIGEWIWFIDADDWIESKALENIVQVLDTNVDLINVDFIKERTGKERTISNCFETGSVVNRNEICEHMFGTKCHFQFIWSNIFKHYFLTENNLFFDESLSLAEDCEFMVRVGKVIRQAKILKMSLYHYAVNMDSASQKWKSGVGIKYMNSIKQIYDSVTEINNPVMKDSFFMFVKDVVKVIVLKDIFHPDNEISWRNRKFSAEKLLTEPIVKESMERPYIGGHTHRMVWNLVKHRLWILLAVISNLYYRMQNKLFWKLYMKVYEV